MNWIVTELNNWPLTLCGIFYSILCIFSIVTGLIYASGRKELNPLELSDKFVKQLSSKKKLKKFTIKMGWITFSVGIVQGLTAIAIFKGYNVILNAFALLFTIFSICSVLFKLKGKINAFPIIKLIFYTLILIILLLAGINNYGPSKESLKFLKSDDKITVSKIKEGYLFAGKSNDKAIIFFPGARVSYKAYAKLMYKFAENGYDCYLLSETLNLAFFNINKPNQLLKKYNYKEWYISGHSLGGVAATLYASNNPKKISGIISLASYPTKEIKGNIKYIALYGSNDKILNINKFNKSKKYLPKDYKIEIIEGGNHSGFANYGNQKGDGEATISNENQQNLVIQTIKNEE